MRTKLFSFLFVLFCSALNAQVPTNGLIYNFKFDNSPTSVAGTETFTSNSTITYTSNRFGNTNKAIAKSYGQLIYTNLTNLPTVNESRSISLWIKPIAVNADNIIFTYGTGSGSQIYGASFNATTIYNFTYTSNIEASSSVATDIWKHVVITYNNSNTVAKIYVNGALVNQGSIGLNTFNTQFYLGSLLNSPTASHFIGAMDDLLIYNRELSDSEVSQIYVDGTPPSNVAVAEYSFDNTYNNLNGNSPFSSNSGTSFIMDRHGNSNGALNIVNTGTSATIINLPYSNTARTISFWAKVNVMQNPYNMTFSYGQPSNSNACGGSFKSDRVEFFGFNNNFAGLTPNSSGTWYYFTYTYNGNEAKIYKNGVVLNTINLNLNTINNNDIFKLGVGVGGELNFNGAIDDLKIYNYVLSDTEISNLYNYNSLGVPQLPIISTVTKKPAAINATIYANVNGNGSAISNVVVKYGTSSGNLTNQGSGIGISPNSYYGTIINGLLENTTYYYRVEVTNAEGTSSTTEDSFATGSKQTVAEYSFDNVYTNFSGNNAFASSAGTSFGNDRNNNPNSALVVNNTSVNGQVPDLPIDGSTRTVSLWAKIDSNASSNYPFSYGGILQDLSFIGVINSNTLEFQSFSNGFTVNETNPINTWMHLVYTYDGVEVKMYKNGVLMGTSPFSLFTSFDDNYFYLASIWGATNTFNGSIDDLKIYNYPLTQTQISNLYNNNTLSTNDFNHNEVVVKMYPNPVQDILNIDLQTSLKSVEVYNIQGQKVLESNKNQINLSSLVSGIYMVRIQDENNAVVTKKIIKK